jgi:hypothetical protein
MFTSMNLGLRYTATVIAVSPAGPSEPAVIMKTVTDYSASKYSSKRDHIFIVAMGWDANGPIVHPPPPISYRSEYVTAVE